MKTSWSLLTTPTISEPRVLVAILPTRALEEGVEEEWWKSGCK